MRSRVHVAVVDDRALLASGLRAMLSAYRDIEVVAEGDLRPGGCVLVGSCATPYQPRPGIRVLELGLERPVVEIVRALHSGAGSQRTRKRGQALSQREQTILSMTAEGSSATQIADTLGVSARTVERYRSAVAEKLAVRSSSHAVAVGVASGESSDVARR